MSFIYVESGPNCCQCIENPELYAPRATIPKVNGWKARQSRWRRFLPFWRWRRCLLPVLAVLRYPQNKQVNILAVKALPHM
jgi:hypothetical protein